MSSRGKILVLWNQTEEDIYEKWREEGPKKLDWSPEREAPDVGTVAEEMEVFVNGLKQGGFEVHLVNVEDDLERLISSIKLYRPDAVFNLVEYFNDDQVQEAYVAGLYEMMGAHYTGNRPVTLVTCQNKYRAKLILQGADLPTAAFFLAAPGQKIPNAAEDYELEYPLIVKPGYEDASGGIEHKSVVHSQEELEVRIQHVHKEFKQPALIEEYIEGREIHAALLGNPPEVLPLFEMEFDDSEFNPEEEWRPQIISFRAKWDPHSKDFYTMDAVVPPEDLDEGIAEYIREVAARAYETMGCRDYARIDMRVDEDGEVYILEVNPNPDLVDGAAYAMCATASGRSYSDTVCAIAQMAVDRSRKKPVVDPEKAGLPSDQLLREHVMTGTPGAAAGAGPAGSGQASPAVDATLPDGAATPTPEPESPPALVSVPAATPEPE